mmetsp:Transcript_5250/g.16875  ORF Transcript_5250/g.16875 Transcript_5250/m.16875 type:complete len:363 (+) Transcript_5250:1357-2445(+)
MRRACAWRARTRPAGSVQPATASGPSVASCTHHDTTRPYSLSPLKSLPANMGMSAIEAIFCSAPYRGTDALADAMNRVNSASPSTPRSLAGVATPSSQYVWNSASCTCNDSDMNGAKKRFRARSAAPKEMPGVGLYSRAPMPNSDFSCSHWYTCPTCMVDCSSTIISCIPRASRTRATIASTGESGAAVDAARLRNASSRNCLVECWRDANATSDTPAAAVVGCIPCRMSSAYALRSGCDGMRRSQANRSPTAMPRCQALPRSVASRATAAAAASWSRSRYPLHMVTAAARTASSGTCDGGRERMASRAAATSSEMVVTRCCPSRHSHASSDRRYTHLPSEWPDPCAESRQNAGTVVLGDQQ